MTEQLNKLYIEWCKETGRSGGVLIGKSLREFFQWLSDNGYQLLKQQS